LLFYLTDFLYFITNIRNRLLQCVLVIRSHHILKKVDVDEMVRMLDLGVVFADCSIPGKTRESCLIALFGMEDAVASFRDGCSSEAIYLLPWALMMTSLQSDVIARCRDRSSLISFRIAIEAFRSCPNKGN
jgi:hypothetical protein